MNQSYSKALTSTGITLIMGSLFFQTAVAAELRPSLTDSKPSQPTVTVPVTNLRPSNNVNITDTLVNPDTDVIDPLCVELNNIAANEGHQATNACNDEYDPTYYPNPTTDEEDDTGPENNGPEPVLFIHGFSATAAINGHDCEASYWGPQKKAVLKKNKNREVKTIGWYSNNTDCDIDLYDQGDSEHYGPNTPIAQVAQDLYNHIKSTYTMQQISVDIVAHSLGGLIVRKMLDDWGDELWVSDVVTLATPHNGVKLGLATLACHAWTQCHQSLHDSDFMNALEHNPQSAIGTKWTLIGAAKDRTIGQNTATKMNQVSNSRPDISKYNYKSYHKHNCGWFKDPLGHGDVHGYNGNKKVRICDGIYDTGEAVKKPTRRMLDALL